VEVPNKVKEGRPTKIYFSFPCSLQVSASISLQSPQAKFNFKLINQNRLVKDILSTFRYT